MSKPVVCIVAALLPHMGIGYRGALPWRLRNEMQYFKQVTSSTFDPQATNAVVMGRLTWESIPKSFRPLANRINVVLTSRAPPGFHQQRESLYESSDLPTAIAALQQMAHVERIYIIGGAQLYAQAAPLASHWLVTKIYCNDPALVPDTDTFLPCLASSRCTEQPIDALAQFLPHQVQLPPRATTLDAGDLNPQHYTHERQFTYWYTLYTASPA